MSKMSVTFDKAPENPKQDALLPAGASAFLGDVIPPHPMLFPGVPPRTMMEGHTGGTWGPGSDSRGHQRRSGFVVRQECPEKLVVGAKWTPSSGRGIGEESITSAVNALLVCFRGVGEPLAESYRNFRSRLSFQRDRPATGKTFVQLPHELPTHQSSEPLVAFSLGDQPLENLNTRNIIRAKLLCKCDEGCGGTVLGKGSDRVVTSLTDSLIQAGYPIPLPRTPIGHRLLPWVNFIGMS